MISPRPVPPDPRLGARIVRRTPLRYDAGADAALDRPAHVRGGSGLALVRGRLYVVQDDANFIAVLDATGAVRAVTLPAGHAGLRQFDDARGNKKFRLDLEACTVAPGPDGAAVLVAFGSGSGKRRDRVVLLEGVESAAPEVVVRHAEALYDMLQATTSFAGSELNIEGAVYRDGRIWLFQRGNGAPRRGLKPVNATCTLDWPRLAHYLRRSDDVEPPAPEDVTQYALGEMGGTPLGFTDATAWGDGFLFTAAAERSPDAERDGPVAGSVLGALQPGGEGAYTTIVDEDGAPFDGKVEGLAPAAGHEGHVQVIVDQDDPTAPAVLCLVELTGPWPARDG